MTQGLDILKNITIFSKYALYMEDKGRRENWPEIIARNKEMHVKQYGHIPGMLELLDRAYVQVAEFKALPSMRSLQFGGKKILSNHCKIYNCSFMHIDCVEAFAEALYLLLCGCGVGYSVQAQHIRKLPAVHRPETEAVFTVQDSIEGWADALKELLISYTSREVPRPAFDFSQIRPAGARIDGSNGKAPGPDALAAALVRIEKILAGADGRQLTSLEAHDILCFAAGSVRSGGIRRSAMIALFSLDDEAMLHCKSARTVTRSGGQTFYGRDANGVPLSDAEASSVQWFVNDDETVLDKDRYTVDAPYWCFEPQRSAANNSAVALRTEIEFDQFREIIITGLRNKSGEPGLALTNNKEWGLNPCAEISFRSNMFCNLTEINADGVVDQKDLNERAWAAAFLGTLQAGYTDFPYLRPVWAERCREEALLGVGMTGIASGCIDDLDLEEAAMVVRRTNAEVAAMIGINVGHRLTCVKPSGTSSCVLKTSSGVHAWYAPYFVRRSRFGKDEVTYQHLKDVLPGLWAQDQGNPNGVVLSLPVQAPPRSVTALDETIQSFLRRLRRLHSDWIRPGHRQGANRHNVSATVHAKEHEWEEVVQELWEMRHEFTGVSVYPYDTRAYQQPPFEALTEEQYQAMCAHVRDIDMDALREDEDNVVFEEIAACAGGACEVVFG